MRKFNLQYLVLLVSVMLVVLHPYTIFGKPGAVVVMLFAWYGVKDGLPWAFVRDLVLPAVLMLAIGTFGALSSAFHGIPQVNHPVAVLAFLILVLGARGFYLYGKKAGLGADDFVPIVLATIVINSIIVLLEIQFDPLRQLIESFLDPISAASINYAEGFRLRGIAVSGGAALSVAIPAGVILALRLFDRQRVGILGLVAILFVLLASVVVIGRSGIVLIAIPVLCYVCMLVSRGGGFSPRTVKTMLFFVMLALISPLFFQALTDFFTDMFGEAFIKYAFGFLLEGEEGIREEGTVGAIAEFLMVLPLQFPEALTGFGFYGGSDFYPWTDSGYSRTFLSVGFVLGLAFYVLLFRIYLLTFRADRFMFGAFILLLAAAETKEPLLYTGVAARMLLVLIVCRYCADLAQEPLPAGGAAAPLRKAVP